MIALLLASLPASAQPVPIVPVTVCVKATTDFVDADLSHGDDLWRGNAAKTLRGIWVSIKDANDFHGSNVWTGYVDPDDGCVDVWLEEGAPHWIRVDSRMDLDGRLLKVTNGSTLYGVMSAGSISPASNQTYTYTIDGSASGLEWVNVAAAASFTMARRLSAWPALATPYEVALQEHPSPDHTTAYQTFDANLIEHEYEARGGVVYIDPAGGNVFRKYIIAHEMGHHLLHFAAWGGTGDMKDAAFRKSYDAPADSDCHGGGPSHSYNSKEYQGAAIIEGHAHYVSAVAFNHTGGPTQTNYDCRIVPSGWIKWDPLSEVFPTNGAFSCEGAEGNDPGGAEYTDFGVDAYDYLGDYCSGGATANRGVEHDWLRFFWDADTDDGVTVFSLKDSVDLLVYAGQFPWAVDDDGGGVLPRVAVEDSFTYFDSGAFADVWDDWAVINGVHR